jgi:hypothetical protein
MVAHQELLGQQVASYLLDLEDHFSSHMFKPLYWTNYEHLINKVLPIIELVNGDILTKLLMNTMLKPWMFQVLPMMIVLIMTWNTAELEEEPDDILISANMTAELEIHTPHI